MQKSNAPRDGVVLRTGVVLEGGFDALEAVLEKREIEKKAKEEEEEEKGEKEEAKRKEGEKQDEEDSDVHPMGNLNRERNPFQTTKRRIWLQRR